MKNENAKERNEMKTATETAACPKCDGSGYIQAFGHVANGVCFCCKGAGTVKAGSRSYELPPIIDNDTYKKGTWIMNSTEASYASLSYAKLAKIRDFVCGGGLIHDAYPELYSHYFEVGESAFQAAQERRLDDFYATRN